MEQSPSNVVIEVLSELAPQEEVTEPELGGGDGTDEAQVLFFKGLNEGNSRQSFQSSSPRSK